MALDVYQLNIIGSTAGEYVENVIHVQGVTSNSTSPEADAASLITGWVTSIQPAWLGIGAADYLIAGYKARRVNNTGGPTSTMVLSPQAPGTVIGSSLSQQAAQLLTGDYFDSLALVPRWRAGRIFYPSVPEGGYTAPSYTGAQATLQIALIAALATGVTVGAGAWPVGVWSRARDNFFVAVYEVSLLVGTIRKRLHPVL